MKKQEDLKNPEGTINPSVEAEHQEIPYIQQRKQQMQGEWHELIKEEDSLEAKRKKEDDFKKIFFRLERSKKTQEQIDAQFSAYKDIMSSIYSLPPELQASNVRHVFQLTPERRELLKKAKNDMEREVMEMGFWDDTGEGLPTRLFESNLLLMLEKSDSAETMRNYFKIFERCLGKISPEMTEKYLRIVQNYGSNNGLSEKSVVGLTEKFLPALQNNDSEVKAFNVTKNIWGMKKGELGTGDFICQCYASEINPKNINSLLMDLHAVPTADSAKLEQNRKDGLAIKHFDAFRDLIHDQHPLVPQVIQAMINYSESHDKSELESLLPKTGGYFGGELNSSRRDKIFNLSNYDEETMIILRRLEKNTEKINEYSESPETSDQELNKAMKDLAEEKDYVPKDLLQKALDIVNSKLQTMGERKEVGIEPNMVSAIAWLERKGYRAVRDMTYEDQLSAYRNPWFHSVLKFQELTASAHNFDEREFNEFIETLKKSKNLKQAYGMVMDRALKNIGELADIYIKSGKQNITGALWSGNLTHELTALIDLKPADTIMGKKHRKEQETSLEYRNTGD